MTIEISVTVRYAETDQMGVAHHAVYPIWYELARTEYIKKFGLTYSQMEEMGIITPLVDLHCRYGGSARYEDELLVSARITALTPARVVFGFSIRRRGEEHPFHTGSSTLAWVDKATFRPVNMKKRFPDLYCQMEAAVEPEF